MDDTSCLRISRPHMGFLLPAVGRLPFPAPHFLLIEAVKHLHAPVYPTLRVKNGYLR